ncbi:hypothetical protein IMCC20628_01733 [Hoeflea sp. IMCC20628]|uniref:hypothetical protein n=1 Tax=Hoeflea sp. IMCC20628 TaxID=1620421 RepID=UPI00063AE73C|nr:hypothetical protein [Hoeflea sp. IMCC20628]AKI00446.1 hypothetical protein IMCC20628_01733 [Hoeflea sp. IMCC20628]
MKLIKLSAALLFSGFITATGALAQTGAECVFTIHNDAADNTLVSFYTSPDDGANWSTNWLGEDMDPGQKATAEFTADTCVCDQVFQAGWLGEDDTEVLDEPHTIDICEASNVYLGDDEVSFD